MIKEIIKSTIVQIFGIFFLSVLAMSLTTRVNDSYGIIDNGAGNILIIWTTFISSALYAMSLAYYDKGKVIYSHGSRLVFRFILLSFIPLILIIQSGDYRNLLLAFHAYATFYLFFDAFYNIHKGNAMFYVGTTANTDKVVRWINTSSFMMRIYPAWYFGLKLILFIGSFLLLVHIWR